MGRRVPENPKEFNDLMLEVDRELTISGYSIPQRPIHALRLVSEKFDIPLPVTRPIPTLKHECVRFWPISERIYQWYEQQYGERMKMDFSPGCMVMLIEGDLWMLRFPRIFGSVSFVVSRSIRSERIGAGSRPITYNVIDAIQDMPPSRVLNLPDKELEHIYKRFILGFKAFGFLEGSRHNTLIEAAIGDVSAAVRHLMETMPQYGLSKWSSLQASEKVLKAAISLDKGEYGKTHNLLELAERAHSLGMTGDWKDLISVIQCSPAIRYGEESCSRNDAVFAHHATLGLIIALAQGGADFKSSLGWNF